MCAGHTCNRFAVTRALAAAQGCGHKTEIARNYAKFFRNQRIRERGKMRKREEGEAEKKYNLLRKRRGRRFAGKGE